MELYPLSFLEYLLASGNEQLDVGLLGALSGLDIGSVLRGNELFVEFEGALTEQFVLQQLLACLHIQPGYWSANQAKSLKSYCRSYSTKRAFRASLSPYREEEWLSNIPLYAISELDSLARQ